MSQSQAIRIPAPLHAQLKALAAARNTTMVGVLHETVRRAVEAGELDDVVPGFHVRLEPSLGKSGEHSLMVVSTPAGELPPMTRQTAEQFSTILAEIAPFLDTEARSISDITGYWGATNVGTGIKLYGGFHDQAGRVESVVTVVFARDLARQLRAAAHS